MSIDFGGQDGRKLKSEYGGSAKACDGRKRSVEEGDHRAGWAPWNGMVLVLVQSPGQVLVLRCQKKEGCGTAWETGEPRSFVPTQYRVAPVRITTADQYYNSSHPPRPILLGYPAPRRELKALRQSSLEAWARSGWPL